MVSSSSLSSFRSCVLVTLYILVLLAVRDIFTQKNLNLPKGSEWRIPIQFQSREPQRNRPAESGDALIQSKDSATVWEQAAKEQWSNGNLSAVQQARNVAGKQEREVRIAASISEPKHEGEIPDLPIIGVASKDSAQLQQLQQSGDSKAEQRRNALIQEHGTWEVLEFSTPIERGLRAYSHFMTPLKRPAYGDLTLSTLLTTADSASIERLSLLARAWRGPLSCSVWLTSAVPLGLEELRRLVRSRGEDFAMTSVHVLWTTAGLILCSFIDLDIMQFLSSTLMVVDARSLRWASCA